MAALLITLLLFANGPISSTDWTKCPWLVRINGSSVYKIVSGCVWKGEENAAKWLTSSSLKTPGVIKCTIL